MLTVNEVSKLTGVSIRALHHYDNIGLLKPASKSKSGYRLYSDENIKKLYQIIIFKELEFSLKEIKEIVSNPSFDIDNALAQQIDLLYFKKERIEKIIKNAENLKKEGGYNMRFDSFNNEKFELYKAEAKEKWGNTEAYKEYEKKSKDYTAEKENELANKMMAIFKDFGNIKDKSPSDNEVQNKVKELKSFITKNFYNCTNEILKGLGQMYIAGGEMTDNIDKSGGKGTAEFVNQAIIEFTK